MTLFPVDVSLLTISSAGRLLSALRRDFGVRLPVDKLFGASRVCELTRLLEGKLAINNPQDASASTASLPGCEETYSSTNPLVLLVNLLPIFILHPMKTALRWIILMYSLSTLLNIWRDSSICARFLSLVTAMAAGRVAVQVATPLIAIVVKWVVIGRYREGMYPMWGPYHTRWWFVQKTIQVGGVVSGCLATSYQTHLTKRVGNVPPLQSDPSVVLQTLGRKDWLRSHDRAGRHFRRVRSSRHRQ